MSKTSIHIEPCKIGSSESHNLRHKELPYVRQEYSAMNQSIVLESDLVDRMATIRETYQRLIGQKMQKTAAPLREGVIVLDEQATLSDVQNFCERIQQRFGIKTLQIHVHEDEGHTDDIGRWIPNRHAHVVFDYFDHTTGKTFRPTRQDMATMQTMLAECLRMERGESSDIKHLNAIQFKNQEQTKQLARIEERISAQKAILTKIVKTTEEMTRLQEIAAKNGLKINFTDVPKREPKFKRRYGI
jgi:hypothetical protein